MNSISKLRGSLRREKRNRQADQRQQKLWLGMTLALIVVTAGSAQSYRVLKSFSGTGGDGAYPYGGLTLLDGKLYGMTTSGGLGEGVLFRMNQDGSDYEVIKCFNDTDGGAPSQGLVGSDGTLYGVTRWGGGGSCGVVFKLNTDGSAYTVLKNFTGSDGAQPDCTLALQGSTLYGTTLEGGGWSNGVVFRVNTDGSGYAVLKSFTGDDGQSPMGRLALSGNTLYGTTDLGGALESESGVVFRLNTDGSGYSVLRSLSTDDGYNEGGLTLGDNTLYWTSLGAVLKMNTDGSGYALLKQCTPQEGMGMYGGVVLEGSTLYGATTHGGSSDAGVIFKLNTDGSGFAGLKDFTGSDGKWAWGGLIYADGTLYGTTLCGGESDVGVVFALTILAISAQPLPQTAEIGSAVTFWVSAAHVPPQPTYHWYFNGTNAATGATNFVAHGTNFVLELTNVQPAQAGAYRIVLGAPSGAVTSAPAMLSIIPRVEQRWVPGLTVMGLPGSVLNLECADTLAITPNRTPFATLALTNTSQWYFDTAAALPPRRFFRAWQTGTPSVIPSLAAHMVPEITLTGSIGDSVRVDAINRFGPTDAWVMLDTVTLSNTSQLYFDTTAPGQPQRLYRLVPVP